MLLIGLAGPAGSGKDTIADYLVEQYGFVKFSFSDRLYAEVSAAFNVPISLLQDRATKDVPTPLLARHHCTDSDFRAIMGREYGFSPRWVLQHWGTEYRRAQNPDYWVNATRKWIDAWLDVVGTMPPDRRPLGLVNSSVRFENERGLIDEYRGETWHLRRFTNEADAVASGVASELHHVAEWPMDARSTDRKLFNIGTIEQLHTAVSLMLQSGNSVSAPRAPLVEYVSCDECGKVHTAVTEAQALAECALYNEYLANLSDEARAGRREATVDDYRGCYNCGESAFTPWHPFEDNDPAGITLSPVIYEAN